MDRFTEIWNEAYNIFTDNNRTESAQYNDMQRFLLQHVRAGHLTMTDKCIIAHDIMETANL